MKLSSLKLHIEVCTMIKSEQNQKEKKIPNKSSHVKNLKKKTKLFNINSYIIFYLISEIRIDIKIYVHVPTVLSTQNLKSIDIRSQCVLCVLGWRPEEE